MADHAECEQSEGGCPACRNDGRKQAIIEAILLIRKRAAGFFGDPPIQLELMQMAAQIEREL